MIKLSIIITSYNKGQYTKKLLDELHKQLTNECEVIFVNDGSTDNTLNIVKDHPITKHKNFVLINNEKNQWVSTARNQGIEHSRGAYLTFIDGDDYPLNNYIKTLLSYTKEQCDVIVYDYQCYSDNPEIDVTLIDKAVNMMCWSRLYKKDFLDKNDIRFDDKWKSIGYGEDGDFNEKVTSIPNAIIADKKDIIYAYRWGVDNSLSNQ